MYKSNNPIPSYKNDFLDWLEIEKGLNSKSQENYSKFLEKFLTWLKLNKLNKLKPHELSPDHIRQYRISLARQISPSTKKTLKKTTQNYYLVALRSLLNFFADRDILSIPSDKIKLPRKKSVQAVDFLNEDQLKSLLEAPDTSTIWGLRDKAILEAFYSTGMRIAELLSLDREQIKLKPETENLELRIVGKGDRPRPVYFSREAVYWLRQYIESRDRQKESLQEKALFINFRNKKSDNHRLSPRTIQISIKKYAIMAGVPITITPHVMRHTFATNMLSKGVDLRTLQEFLGHKNITATQIYTHVTSKRLRDIHRKIHDDKA
ncbi:MAG: tyrosine-type recombinase/integrase [Parcubacteria group bacterium]|nr:tyrosine-type recombinase/integrase [Parcubacteria group bacterium]